MVFSWKNNSIVIKDGNGRFVPSLFDTQKLLRLRFGLHIELVQTEPVVDVGLKRSHFLPQFPVFMGLNVFIKIKVQIHGRLKADCVSFLDSGTFIAALTSSCELSRHWNDNPGHILLLCKVVAGLL